MPEDQLPSSRPLPDLIGGRYRIVSRLGVGGMGVVYKAVDEQLNRAVAVKALEDRRYLMAGASGRLRTEALAAASLDHPYICKVYELVETPTDAFIIMEFVEGETLSAILKRGPLPLLLTLQVAREIAEGLAEAHAHGLVHRDVKPANVMMTPSGHVKLLDFGVAGADVHTNPGEHTRTIAPQLTINAGTPHYMAPEQAAGQPVTTRADLFSLGVVMYECLTGALPFSGSTTFDYVRHLMQSPPRRLDRVAPDMPADLVDLVDRCLEKAPVERPESADAVVSELRRLSAALTSPGASIRTARHARSGRRWQTIAAAALVVAAIAIGWRFIWPHASTDDGVWQSRPFVTSAAQEFDSAISPDGQWVSFISTNAGVSQIMVQRVDGGDARPLTIGQGTPVSQIWSPDGTQLACVLNVKDEWVLQIYPAFFGGEPRHTAALGGTKVTRVDLLRWIDRTIYMQVMDPSASLQRIDADTPASLTNLSAAWKLEGQLRGLDVAPDGRSVVMARSANGQEDLWTSSIDGSSARAITSDVFFDRYPLWNGRGDRIIFTSNRGGQTDLWEFDPRTKTLNHLTSGEAEKTPNSTSKDGSLLSFELESQGAKLWAWDSGGQSSQQLTQDALSDYAPVISANGRAIAFQRSLPTPSAGAVIMDAKIFVAPFDGKKLTEAARSIDDGYAAALSADGDWIAYLQRGGVPKVATLQVRNRVVGATSVVSRAASVPIWSQAPVDWATTSMTWSPKDTDLYFVEGSDRPTIRRFHAGEKEPGPPLIETSTADTFIRDLHMSNDSRSLGYLLVSREAVGVHVLDVTTSADRQIAKLPVSMTGTVARGWAGDEFIVVRRVTLHEDLTSDAEVLAIHASGAVRRAGTISNAFIATARLHASRRVIYVTRIEGGVQNVYEFVLGTGALKPLTQNVLSGVTFSGFGPFGPDRLIGVREERRQDIWLIQQAGTSRPGNPAGR